MMFVGIDLGTTNCSLAYADGAGVKDLKILQRVAWDQDLAFELLPSYIYLPQGDQGTGLVCGLLAKSLAGEHPKRVISSAKSWIGLGQTTLDSIRLPLQTEDSPDSLSPIQAQAELLRVLRHRFEDMGIDLPEGVVITIPASFSELARRYTLDASHLAGYAKPVLLEEPLAAFYNWQSVHKATLPEGSLVLIVDVGGGTTDFSLIRCQDGHYSREAVGQHLLLGGDNLDLTLALAIEKNFDLTLSPAEFGPLLAQVRQMKEDLSSDSDSYTLVIPGQGTRMFSQSRTVTIKKEFLQRILLDGFFPVLAWEDNSGAGIPESGLRQFGLPYESDPAITRHLLRFLRNWLAPDQAVSHVLFHGGSMQSREFQQRISTCLNSWFSSPVTTLENPHYSLGVSRGAVVYALARQGLAPLIQAGISHATCLGIEIDGEEWLLCVARAKQTEGEVSSPEQILQLRTKKRFRFSLYRLDRPDLEVGATFRKEGQVPVCQLQVKLAATDPVVPVRLEAELLPTSEVRIVIREQKNPQCVHVLDFDLQQGDQVADTAGVVWNAINDELDKIYGRLGAPVNPRQIDTMPKRIEELLGQSRSEWTAATCRRLAWQLLDKQKARRRTVKHEQVFLNLIGICLRPGFGHRDDRELMCSLDLTFPVYVNSVQNRLEYWILLRRVSAGLSREFQLATFASYSGYVFQTVPQVRLPGSQPTAQELLEMLRAFCSFDSLAQADRTRLFELVFRKLKQEKLQRRDFWLIGRLAARQLIHRDPAAVVPAVKVEELGHWLLQSGLKGKEVTKLVSAICSQESRHAVIDATLKAKLQQSFAVEDTITVNEVAEESYSVGEELPLGLRLGRYAG